MRKNRGGSKEKRSVETVTRMWNAHSAKVGPKGFTVGDVREGVERGEEPRSRRRQVAVLYGGLCTGCLIQKRGRQVFPGWAPSGLGEGRHKLCLGRRDQGV